MSMKDKAKFYQQHMHGLRFTIEEVSEIVRSPVGTIRSQISRGRSVALDANIGQKGSRVLFSPSDLMQLIIISKLSHLGVSFTGKSPIERKFLLEDGKKPSQRESEHEVLANVMRQTYIIIADMAGTWPKRDPSNPEPERRYVAIYFDPTFTQTINDVKYRPGMIMYEAHHDPLSVSEVTEEGMVVIFDCLSIATQVLEAI